MQLVYNYHPVTKEFTSAEIADQCPIKGKGHYLVADHATLKEVPLVGKNEIAVFNGERWETKLDFRNELLFSTLNGAPVKITEIGKTPDDVGATSKGMPSQAHSWKNGEWVFDTEKEAIILERSKSISLEKINKFHSTSLQAMVGNPTEEEKSTWALKLEIANSSPDREPLGQAALAFLDAIGVLTEEQYDEWTKTVRERNATYGRAVGLCERYRNELKQLVKNAKNLVELTQPLAMRIAELNEEVASRIAGTFEER